MCLWVKGQSQLYCHNRLQAGEPQNSAELALGGQRSTGEGRQVDRVNLPVTVAAGMFWQLQSDIYILWFRVVPGGFAEVA